MGIPPVRTWGNITGAQANGANNGSSLQGQQQSQPVKAASAGSLSSPSGIISARKPEPVKAASAVSLPRLSSMLSASKAEPVKSVAATGPLNVRNAVTGSPGNVLSSSSFNKPPTMAPFSKEPTVQNNPSPSFVVKIGPYTESSCG